MSSKSQTLVTASTLTNGVRVLSQRNTKFAGAGLAITLLGGSREESSEQIGLSHLLEHLLFKRTEEYGPIEIAQAIDALGGDINASTDTDEINLYGEVPGENLFKLLELFSEMLLQCNYNDKDLSIEKDVIRQEISDAKDDPETVVFHKFSEMFWPDSSFGMPVFGYSDTVESLGKEEVNSRLKELLVGSRLLITVVSEYEHEEILEKVESIFGRLPTGAPAKIIKPNFGAGSEIISCSSEQVYLCMGLRWPNLLSQEVYTGQIISNCFGELMSSRLFQELREKRGLAYEIGTDVESYADTGSFLIQGSFEPKRAEEALSLIASELEVLRKDFLTDDEIDRAKVNLLSRLTLDGDSLSSLLWRLQESETLFGRYISIEEDLERISSINHDDINNFINKWFNPHSHVVVLGSDTESIQIPSSLTNLCLEAH